MTRTEVLEAFRVFNNEATHKDIMEYVGTTQQHVLQRMLKWKEITARLGPQQIGGRAWIYTLIIN